MSILNEYERPAGYDPTEESQGFAKAKKEAQALQDKIKALDIKVGSDVLFLGYPYRVYAIRKYTLSEGYYTEFKYEAEVEIFNPNYSGWPKYLVGDSELHLLENEYKAKLRSMEVPNEL